MNPKKKRKNQAKWIRVSRKIHRLTGLSLFVFFAIVSITTILLGWKKDSAGYLLAETAKGSSTTLSTWLPLDTLSSLAENAINEELGTNLKMDRMDVREQNGIVKVSFKDSYWGVQLDGTTGETLNIGLRRSDFIEDVHDGSILDTFFNTGTEILKLIYTSIMGISLLIFTLTGFWLWYGPKRMKKK